MQLYTNHIELPDLESILQISDEQLGKDYLDKQYLSNMLTNSNNQLFKVADDQQILGFSISSILSMEAFSSTFPHIHLKIEKGQIGWLKTIAVKPELTNLGIGIRLLHHTLEHLCTKSDQQVSIVWDNPEKNFLPQLLMKYGFSEHSRLENHWHRQSLEKGFHCPVCGTPPCSCAGMIYMKKPTT